MANPSNVLVAYLKVGGRELDLFKLGMLGMALEIVTRIRVLESLPITTDVGRQEAIVCLHTMLVEMGLDDEAYQWYDVLGEWRKPKFVSDVASDLDVLSSAAVALRGVQALGDDTHGRALERRSSDPADGLASGS